MKRMFTHTSVMMMPSDNQVCRVLKIDYAEKFRSKNGTSLAKEAKIFSRNTKLIIGYLTLLAYAIGVRL